MTDACSTRAQLCAVQPASVVLLAVSAERHGCVVALQAGGRVLAAGDGHRAAQQPEAHRAVRADHGALGGGGDVGGADLLPLHAVRRHLLPEGATGSH